MSLRPIDLFSVEDVKSHSMSWLLLSLDAPPPHYRIDRQRSLKTPRGRLSLSSLPFSPKSIKARRIDPTFSPFTPLYPVFFFLLTIKPLRIAAEVRILCESSASDDRRRKHRDLDFSVDSFLGFFSLVNSPYHLSFSPLYFLSASLTTRLIESPPTYAGFFSFISLLLFTLALNGTLLVFIFCLLHYKVTLSVLLGFFVWFFFYPPPRSLGS